MQISAAGINQIKKHEGLRLKSYYDAVGKPTIGYGNTFYENGKPVRMGEVISMARAESLLRFIVDKSFSPVVSNLVTSDINQNQFDALVSFAYNVGNAALASSTLLKKVNAKPADPSIEQEFLKWDKGTVKGKKVVLPGLSKRRKDEWNLYNTKQ